jgi:DMSO/TMAO reductase YedYZ molybdopterin-dependent catalytic subunit
MTPPGTGSTRRNKPAGRRPRRLAAIAAGLLAATVAIGVAQLVAGITGPDTAPVVAVGAAVIDLAPRPIKDFAITTFGEQDKTVLLACTAVLLVTLAGLVGPVAIRRPRWGVGGVLVLGAVGALAAATRPNAGPLGPLPSVVGAAAGAVALVRLIRPLRPAPRGFPTGTEAPDSTEAPDESPAATARRRFLVTGALAFGTAWITGGAGLLLGARSRAVASARAQIQLPAPADTAPALPGDVDLMLAGLTPFSTPGRDFYRVDTALVTPRVDPRSWSLRVHGMVARELRLSYRDLLARPLVARDITLTCVSNEVGGTLAGTARWTGVRVADLLAEAGVAVGAEQVLSRSADGWTASTPVDLLTDGRDALLVVGMNGEPLPPERGFPVRMVVPGLYGYVSATKWLVDMELTTFAAKRAYWTQRGWADRGPIKVSSRIDTPSGSGTLAAGTVPVAGVAWAQHRGIAAVEVRIDDGDWQSARLAGVPGPDTWRQWVFRWQATPGSHTITCRATDATGATQPEEQTAPFPDGATGWHSIVVTVR